MDSATIATTIKTITRAPKTTATKANQLSLMAPKSSVSSALDQRDLPNMKAIGPACRQPQPLHKGKDSKFHH